MTLNELLIELFQRGVKLSIDAGENSKLRIQAPKGAITSELQLLLSDRKAKILSLIRDSQQSLETNDLPAIDPRPQDRYQPFPLTDLQHAFWIGRNGALELGNVANHGYYEIEGKNLKLDRLNEALQKLIVRHDMLRAIVQPDGQQKVLEQVPPYSIKVLDLREETEAVTRTQIETVRRRLSHQVMPTNRWPLFEFSITLLQQNKYRLHISYDLQIFDAWSLFRFFDEWFQLYQNPQFSLKPLSISFRDYVLAERKLEQTELYRRSQEYWLARLDNLPTAPDLPLARNPKELNQPSCQRYEAKLTKTDWQQLKQKAAQIGLTPSGILLAAFTEMLTIWSKNPQFTINLALFNRLPLHTQVNDILGDFTSVTLLAVDNSRAESFSDRAVRLQKQLWQDLEHRYFSGVRVVRELARKQGTTPNAMPIVFTSTLGMDTSGQEVSTFSHFGELVYGISQASQVWLDFQVWQSGEALSFNWDVVEELFPEGLIQDMFEAYCHFLQQLASPQADWQTVNQQLIPDHQLAKRQSFNDTKASIADEMLHTLFTTQVKNSPDECAVISSPRNLSYGELSNLVNQVAHKLRSLVTPNQLVAVVMEKGWSQIVAVLGILTAGAAYVPIDPNLPPERQEYILKNSQVKVVLTQSWLKQQISGLVEGIIYICIDNQELAHESTEFLEPVQTSDDLAYLIYTSGSTGVPKGVMINHRGAVNTILDINRRFQVSPRDRLLALSSLSFDLSVYDIFGTLAAGGTIVIPDANLAKPAHWFELMVQHQVNIWNSAPALMEMLLNCTSDRLELLSQSLRLVMLSGDWLPLNLPPRIRNICPDVQLISLGGATEASIWSILYPINRVDPTWKSIPYGRPMANQHFYVLDENLATCPTWVTGHLYIGGLGLAKGYWGSEDKTKSSFIVHPQTKERLYKTGDLGRYLPAFKDDATHNGNIEFLGREDFQIKINGYRVELGEIETVLTQHQAIRAAVVTAVGEKKGNKRLVAYLVLDPEKTSEDISGSASEILPRYLAQKLPDYMIPVQYLLLDSLPVSANGKIDRRKLQVKEVCFLTLEDRYAPPENNVEQTIANIWQEVLTLPKVGVKDKFFDLGGDSLSITKVYSQLQQNLPEQMQSISLVDLFKYPTIRGLAENLNREQQINQLQQQETQLQQRKNRLKQRFQRSKTFR